MHHWVDKICLLSNFAVSTAVCQRTTQVLSFVWKIYISFLPYIFFLQTTHVHSSGTSSFRDASTSQRTGSVSTALCFAAWRWDRGWGHYLLISVSTCELSNTIQKCVINLIFTIYLKNNRMIENTFFRTWQPLYSLLEKRNMYISYILLKVFLKKKITILICSCNICHKYLAKHKTRWHW